MKHVHINDSITTNRDEISRPLTRDQALAGQVQHSGFEGLLDACLAQHFVVLFLVLPVEHRIQLLLADSTSYGARLHRGLIADPS